MSIVEYARALCVSTERLRLACVRSTASSPLALLNARRLLEAQAQSSLYQHEHRADRGNLRLHRSRVLLAFLCEEHGQVGEGISLEEVKRPGGQRR